MSGDETAGTDPTIIEVLGAAGHAAAHAYDEVLRTAAGRPVGVGGMDYELCLVTRFEGLPTVTLLWRVRPDESHDAAPERMEVVQLLEQAAEEAREAMGVEVKAKGPPPPLEDL